MSVQKSFGEFTAERFGPYWVYGHSKKRESFARNGERQTVITKVEQKKLAADYRREWGREHDAPLWAALCALRAASKDASFAAMAPETQDAICYAIQGLTL